MARFAARVRYARGLRPLPLTNTLPDWLPRDHAWSDGAYEGEPRDTLFLDEACHQVWVHQWVDIVVELWNGPIDLEGERRLLQRNETLRTVAALARVQSLVVEAYRREGLKGAREVLMHWTIGPPPMLIEEFEAGIRHLGQVS